MAVSNAKQQARLALHGLKWNNRKTLPEPEISQKPSSPPPKYTWDQKQRTKPNTQQVQPDPDKTKVAGQGSFCTQKYATIGLAIGLAVALAGVIGLLCYVLVKELRTDSDSSQAEPCQINNGGCAHNCSSSTGGPVCSCMTGYTLTDGYNCEDIDECSSDHFPNCHHVCINTNGSYACYCNTGYQLDWDLRTCIDSDECASGNGGCAQSCTNTEGSYYCDCADGYWLDIDKYTCNDRNECLTNNGWCSDICNNTPGSYFCSCSDWHEMLPDNHNCEVCLSSVTCTGSGPIDCQDIYDHGHTTSGSCALCINSISVPAYCEMDATNGIGWTAIQRRISGDQDFDQDWATYEAGFGDPADSFWLGLTHIHNLTTARTYLLKIDLTDQSGTDGSAYYSTFSVGDASSKYQLTIADHVAGAPVDAGDSLYSTSMPARMILNGQPFTTNDVDNDNKGTGNCAVNTFGGWWHNNCAYSNLNAKWNPSGCTFTLVNWRSWHDDQCSMSFTQMKLKRL